LRRSRVDRAKRRHREDIAGVKLIEHSAKLRSVGLGSARHFAKDFFSAGGGQRRDLRLDALAVRRYPCIAVNHASFCTYIMHEERGRISISMAFSQATPSMGFGCHRVLSELPRQSSNQYLVFSLPGSDWRRAA
jgi:hypothetical protein